MSGVPTAPQLSIQLLNFAQSATDWEPLLQLAATADRAGVDRLVVSDHVLFGERLGAYGDPSTGGIAGGRQPTTSDGHWLEPMTLLSVIAGRTRRVRLGTSILLAALRTPTVLAMQAATLDVMSGGRLDLGVGVGWQREEYEASGLSFEGRGELLDHCLEVCRRLWTESVVDGVIGDARFDNVHAAPKPLQPGGVPIWVSGRATARTAARLARFGVGWIPWGDDAVDPRPGIAVMRAAFAAAGRDPSGLLAQGTLPVVRENGRVNVEASMAGVSALADTGVTDFRVPYRWGVDPVTEADLLEALVGAFRLVTGASAT